jgi:hypothetical protein
MQRTHSLNFNLSLEPYCSSSPLLPRLACSDCRRPDKVAICGEAIFFGSEDDYFILPATWMFLAFDYRQQDRRLIWLVRLRVWGTPHMRFPDVEHS